MTVCIATIYSNNTVLGVSDRMITAGDIEFQPPQEKILQVTSSIATMTAGDANIQTQIYLKVLSLVNKRIATNPNKWIPVEDVAKLYRDTYTELKKHAAERAILSPYGLNYDLFISRQNEMSEDFVQSITYKLECFEIEGVETIVGGVDETGAHIYVVRNEELSCDDRVGFAAIGIGASHALSHLMLAGYTRTATESKALWSIYQAKKKAEVSPGVGEETDMFLIGPSTGTFILIKPVPGLNIIKDLDGIYKKYKAGINRSDKRTEVKIKDYLIRLNQPSDTKQEINQPSASASASIKVVDSKIVKGKSEKPI